MEEKERYIKYDPDDNGIITRTIYDTIEKKPIIVTIDRCIGLLNQQDKRIKELEEELRIVQYYKTETNKFDYELRKENQQLKQQLKEKDEQLKQAKEIINNPNTLIFQQEELINSLNKQLKEKDEELNRYAELFEMKDKDFYVIEKAEYEKMKAGAKEIVKQAVKDNTKQVCEKIRKKSSATTAFFDNEEKIVQYSIAKKDLDQIEKGEI
ncbi:MAG: hypothetical protein ACI4R8_01205 [Candidatus Caccovivens sp.]